MELLRIVDANLNRAREGLRVVEEIGRFYLNDRELFLKFKQLRHILKDGEKSFETAPCLFRQSEIDVGAESDYLESERKNLNELITANFKRIEESLRVLEEYSKLLTGKSEYFKHARFITYELEKEIMLKIPKLIDYSLYLVTDDVYLKDTSIFSVIEQCIMSGVTVLQYRAKEKTSREMLREAERLREITKKYDVPLIINDRIDLALAVDADGVHLGQDDLTYETAKKYLGHRIIGISSSTYEQAKEAIENGADYIGHGPIFPTPTKKDAHPACGMKSMADIRMEFPDAKIIAIGGISIENAEEVIKAGANGLAVVSAVLGSVDPPDAVKRFKNILEGKKIIYEGERHDTTIKSP